MAKKARVYVVTAGSYSDYGIEAIFSNRAAADEFAAKDEGQVEVYDLLEVVPQQTIRYSLTLELGGTREWSAEYWPWEMSVKDALPARVQTDEWFPLTHFYGKAPSPEEAIAQGFPFALSQPSGRIVFLRLQVAGTDKEAVRKVFYDRLAQRKAEAEGISA